MFVIAIDPGLTGALAVLDAKGWLAAVHDTPTLCLRVSRGRAEALLLAEYGRRQGHQGIANAPQVTRQTGRQRPMKPSKFEGGGFYCTVKEPDGSYCKAKA